MKILSIIICLLIPVLAGCSRHPSAVAVVRADSVRSLLGQRVTLSGIAEPRKLGAAVRCDGFDVWIDGLQDWPQDFTGHRVHVTGVLEERHDLPVFTADTPEERMRVQGIPVPSGTDLHEASRRYIIRDAKWTLIR